MAKTTETEEPTPVVNMTTIHDPAVAARIAAHEVAVARAAKGAVVAKARADALLPSGQMIELENRMRWTIDLGTFDNPNGNPDRVHVCLGSKDDMENENLAKKTDLVIPDGKLTPPIRVFPRAVIDAAMQLKANAGMVDLRQIMARGA